MGFENKILSREISQLIWENGKTLGTAESCTGGRIAESIIAMPGASNYFKGGIVSYTNKGENPRHQPHSSGREDCRMRGCSDRDGERRHKGS